MNPKKVVVITGASKGIGRATAKKFIKAGYIVYDLSRSGVEFDGCRHIYCDVVEYSTIEAALDKIINECGRIDIAISNAGIGISGSLEGHSYEMINMQINTNILGATYFAKLVLKHIRETKGRLIFISSLAADVPIPFQSVYSMTKAGLKSLAMSLDNEIRPSGARACVIMPGDLSTSFTISRIKNEYEEDFYETRVKNSVSKMEKDELSGAGPEIIADYLYQLAKKNNPKVVSSVGSFYKFISFISKILPVRLKNLLIYRIYASK